jgi:hypothetical protein
MARHEARHAAPKTPTARRALLALTTASLALGAGAGAASADVGKPVNTAEMPKEANVKLAPVDVKAGLGVLRDTAGYAVAPVGNLKPNPLAGTGVDPLDNGVGTQVADFKPVTSKQVTGPVAQADDVDALPVAGPVISSLHK